MPIVYCLIGRGVVVEVDVSHPLHSGNFKLVALKLLNKVHQQYETAVQQQRLQPAQAAASPSSASPPPSPFPPASASASPQPGDLKRQTLLFDNHTFNFLSLGPVHCLALCTRDVKQHTAFLFLADVMETYRRGAAQAEGGDGGLGPGSGGADGDRLQGNRLKVITDVLNSKMDQYNNSAHSGTAEDKRDRRKGETQSQNDSHTITKLHKQPQSTKDKKGKHGGKSTRRAAADSLSTADAVAGLRDDSSGNGDTFAQNENPDAVHNVKRELEVSEAPSTHNLTQTRMTIAILRVSQLVDSRTLPLCLSSAECEGYIARKHRSRLEPRRGIG